ncbi:transcriptional regulator FixK [Pseudooceanicola batsensis HTCC2597]|uniref:Transcriptional regulator FixK n=1 Tax=Pseudooceanicola batsensis (strain ATCC BAA-863 / DSM 15984 / KCTC 12145 / HTCC2597) TaxID=252305 RepID=A3U181_PSEBH|nr:cbb3-type cytochrome oxidase assembly protein CcoS [Pseudooceanicola batsensis]EAQ02064.1 transcriptional regulator FixK [Pseudooceanicola batsensis HTCC2597]
MNILIVLIPVSVALGAAGLAACLWTLRNGQYEDLEGDAARILLEETPPSPRGAETKTPAAPE